MLNCQRERSKRCFMYNYSIVKANEDHVEEICQDIIRQTKEGITDLALFSLTLMAEGDPVIDKAAIEGAKYIKFRDRLKQEGVEVGILVQATIGHGYPLNADFPYQHVIDLKGGERRFVTCPYDEGFRDYLRKTFKTVASLSPKTIMVDDDFRLMGRPGRGCACPLHMKAVSRLAGREVTREELSEAIFGEKKDEKLKKIFFETQKDSLLGGAMAMREGIDAVNPDLSASFCCVGPSTEFAADIAKILAGKNGKPMVRVNNGNYTPAGAKRFNEHIHRAAKQIAVLKEGGVEVLLAETDTCPQNRYSTSAQNLHAHFTGTILEGAGGAKHWITRLAAFEPASGEAYRKKLAENRGFYQTLSELRPQIKWKGCVNPVSPSEDALHENAALAKYGWSVCVFERLGLPCFFSSDKNVEGAIFMEDIDVSLRTDEELMKFFEKTVVLSGEAARLVNERGLMDYTGVEVRKWKGANLSGEDFPMYKNRCNAQIRSQELIPQSDAVDTLSTVYHLKDGKVRQPLFPGVTSFKNPAGGTTIVFCGDPNTNYNYLEAFSFLNETRKRQLVDILKATGNLPVYYPDDMEMLLRAGELPDGSLFVAAFDLSLDRAETLSLMVDGEVERVEQLAPTGEFKEVSFTKDGNRIEVNTPVYTLEPIILKLHRK